MITKNDLIGIWYNENFKLVVESNKIFLNTNIETEHKPFYTKEIYSDVITWVEAEKTIEMSNNITLLKSENISKVLVISLQTDRIELIRLTKFN